MLTWGFCATHTLFWKLCKCWLLGLVLQLSIVFAHASEIKLFNRQDSIVSGNQDLTVVLDSHPVPEKWDQIMGGSLIQNLAAEIVVDS